MHNIESESMGKFIADLRKEKNLTQNELGDLLHVTDKTISKWETGRGFPDIKLLKPLADVLDISVTELLNGRRFEGSEFSIAEIDSATQYAVKHSRNHMYQKILHILWFLAGGLSVILALSVYSMVRAAVLIRQITSDASAIGIIGGADGPTSVFVTSSFNIHGIVPLFVLLVLIIICIVFAINLGHRIEKD